jgi:hypothetical protein
MNAANHYSDSDEGVPHTCGLLITRVTQWKVNWCIELCIDKKSPTGTLVSSKPVFISTMISIT